jgi:hypothetical protein
VERLYLAAGLGATVYSAFFLALLARPLFGRSLYDENGYPPFPLRLVGRGWRWDANVTAFTSLTVLLLAAVATISRPD